MKKLLACFFACSVATLGPAGTAGAADEDARAAAESLNAAWNQALNSGDAAALAALYAADAVLSPGNGQALRGRAEIRKLFQGFVDAGVHNHTLEIVEAHGQGGFLYQVAKWSANGAEKDGVKPAFGGITTSVYARGDDGRWRARSHVWNAAN